MKTHGMLMVILLLSISAAGTCFDTSEDEIQCGHLSSGRADISGKGNLESPNAYEVFNESFLGAAKGHILPDLPLQKG